MNQDKLNFSLLFLLPLCSNDGEKWIHYTKELFPYKITGDFINGYAHDINKPYLDKSIFLVFKSEATSDMDELLIRKDSFLTRYSYRIDGEFFSIYALTPRVDSGEVRKDWDKILNGNYVSISTESKEKIIKFWGSVPNSNISLILDGRINVESPESEVIPEADDIEFDLD